jgi:hypothetical protein
MTIENRTTVKTYFQTGDKPSQDQFENFIDSAIFYEDTSNFGRQLVSASSATSARNLLGVGTVGNNLFTAITTASAQNELGGKTVGKILFETNTTASAQTQIGGGVVGRQIFEATTTASATNIILQPATSTAQGVNYLSNPTNLPSITINSTTPNTTLDISAGVINHDDGSAQFVVSAMSKIIQSTGSWTAGTGQNGLDTGARANSTWYQVFIIRKTSDGTSDILFSTSRTSLTIPIGYTLVAWLGAMRTNASGNIDASYFAKRTSFGQVVSYIESNIITGAGAIPYDDTPPQNNEGAQYMELAFYPLSTTSRINTIVNWNGCSNSAYDLTLALFKNSDANAIRAIPWNTNGGNVQRNLYLYSSEIIGSISLQTYKVRVGASSSVNLAMNGNQLPSTRLYGGVASSSILIYEFI